MVFEARLSGGRKKKARRRVELSMKYWGGILMVY
jgi:hypothetical protein